MSPKPDPGTLSKPSRSPPKDLFRNPLRTILRSTPRAPKASPEATSPKASFKTPSEHARPKDPYGALRSTPRVPKPAESPFEASVETPSGPSFGECRVSRQPARKPPLRKPPSKRLRNMPRVPKVKPKAPLRNRSYVPKPRRKPPPSKTPSKPSSVLPS